MESDVNPPFSKVGAQQRSLDEANTGASGSHLRGTVRGLGCAQTPGDHMRHMWHLHESCLEQARLWVGSAGMGRECLLLKGSLLETRPALHFQKPRNPTWEHSQLKSLQKLSVTAVGGCLETVTSRVQTAQGSLHPPSWVHPPH